MQIHLSRLHTSVWANGIELQVKHAHTVQWRHHRVHCLQVCPSAVGVGMLGLPGGPPSASSGRGGDAVALLAAVTAAGNVEFVTLQRGAVCPLMGTVSVSLGTANC